MSFGLRRCPLCRVALWAPGWRKPDPCCDSHACPWWRCKGCGAKVSRDFSRAILTLWKKEHYR